MAGDLKRVLLPTVSRKEKINFGVGKCGCPWVEEEMKIV